MKYVLVILLMMTALKCYSEDGFKLFTPTGPANEYVNYDFTSNRALLIDNVTSAYRIVSNDNCFTYFLNLENMKMRQILQKICNQEIHVSTGGGDIYVGGNSIAAYGFFIETDEITLAPKYPLRFDAQRTRTATPFLDGRNVFGYKYLKQKGLEKEFGYLDLKNLKFNKLDEEEHKICGVSVSGKSVIHLQSYPGHPDHKYIRITSIQPDKSIQNISLNIKNLPANFLVDCVYENNSLFISSYNRQSKITFLFEFDLENKKQRELIIG